MTSAVQDHETLGPGFGWHKDNLLKPSLNISLDNFVETIPPPLG